MRFIIPGETTVVFECAIETDLVLIHSNKLNYTKQANGQLATLTSLSGTEAPSINSSWLQVKTQYLVLELNGKLTKGHWYQIYTEFTGELADDLGGFYRSEYMENGKKKYVSLTETSSSTPLL